MFIRSNNPGTNDVLINTDKCVAINRYPDRFIEFVCPEGKKYLWMYPNRAERDMEFRLLERLIATTICPEVRN